MKCAVVLFLVAAGASAVNDIDADFGALVQSRGYPFEMHQAPTADGVQLTLFRIPRAGAPVVFMQHGILDSAWGWVFNQEFKALAFQIHDAGYDVWMGNNRGTDFSTKWADGSDASGETRFWNFTFDDMGRQDVPGSLKLALQVSGQPRLAYLAHSRGTTQFFIGASEAGVREWLGEHVSVFVALSPVAWLAHTESFVLKALAETHVQDILWPLFPKGFLNYKGWREAANILCTATLGVVCKISVDLVCGSSSLDHPGNIDSFSKYFPYGTSYKDIVHFAQSVTKDTFRRYDYGSKNIEIYGRHLAPDYNVSQITVPTALFIASKDDLVDPRDLQRLQAALPRDKVVFQKVYEGFSHVTWTLGAKEAAGYVADVLQVLGQHHGQLHGRAGATGRAALVV